MTEDRTEADVRASTGVHDPVGSRPMSLEEIRSSYAESADWMDRMAWFDPLLVGRYRRRLFSTATGSVLDVACGTGTNFRYLPPAVDLVGIDASRAMLTKARRRLERLDLEGSLHEMDAQALALCDDRFDTVISSLSTCTFPDPVAALGEVERVCKPDGRILLLEHGRSDVGAIARIQDWHADAHYRRSGCRWNQEPAGIVSAAGLSIEATATAALGIVTAIVARPTEK